MGRGKRQISSSGIYHIVNKGVSNQIIFEDSKDKDYFLLLLKIHKEAQNIRVLAYCLMENHFHLLILDEENHLSKFMQNLCSEYATYFNRKYLRCGHLFNDRFKNECIEDDSYLLTVLRYIIQNPQKAGICKSEDYKWSSYEEYFSNERKIIDSNYIEGFFCSKKEFYQFLENENLSEKQCLEIKEYSFFGIFDETAKKIIKEKLKLLSCSQIRTFERKKRNEILIYLRNEGFSIKLLERLTGVSRGVIQKL